MASTHHISSYFAEADSPRSASLMLDQNTEVAQVCNGGWGMSLFAQLKFWSISGHLAESTQTEPSRHIQIFKVSVSRRLLPLMHKRMVLLLLLQPQAPRGMQEK